MDEAKAPALSRVTRGRPARALLALAVLIAALAVVPASAAPPPGAGEVVAPIERGHALHPALAEAVPHVGAPRAWSIGATGAGKVIAVIDTGVNSGFGGTLVGSACIAATERQSGAATVLDGHCGPAGGELRAYSDLCFQLGVCDQGDPSDVPDPDAGRPCPADAHACAHGSAVAASAARHDAPQGVAPDASIYAVRVFDDDGRSADLVDVYLALDHVRQMAEAGLNVVAVNLSVATGARYSTACDGDEQDGGGAAFHAVIGQLLADGIPTTVAAGNAGDATGIAFPACVSNAIAVGATDDDDDIASYSNTSPDLDLLAPGSREASPGVPRVNLTIPSGTGSSSWSGTSFAAPMAAGGLALLSDLYPKATVRARVAFLERTGAPVHGFHRLRLGRPSELLHAGTLFPASAALTPSSRAFAGDFDGDGRADVFAYAPGPAADRIAWGTTAWSPSVASTSVSGTYLPLVGQLRGAADGPEDILWYAPGPSGDFLWSGQANKTFASTPVPVSGGYSPVVADFDGDGWDDVFWYAAGAGGDHVWYGGASGFSVRSVTASGTWRVAAGDFDGDGRADLLLHAPGAAADQLWLGSATRGAFTKRSLTLNGSYTPIVADVDGDHDDDVVLYQPGPGSDYLWRGGPAVRTGTGSTAGFAQTGLTISGTYTPAVGDLDGDGDDEIVWYAAGGAADSIWFGRPTGLPTRRGITIALTYRLVVADLDGAEGDELVFASASSGSTPIWWSDGTPP